MDSKDQPQPQTEVEKRQQNKNTVRVTADGKEYEITYPVEGDYSMVGTGTIRLSYPTQQGDGERKVVPLIQAPGVHLRVATNSMGWRTIGVATDPKFAESGGKVQALVVKKDDEGNAVIDPNGKPQYTWQSADRTDGPVRYHEAYTPGFGTKNYPNVTLGVNFRTMKSDNSAPSYFKVIATFSGSTAQHASDSNVYPYIAPLQVNRPNVK